MKETAIALLEWFRNSARRMEWRETDDPYRIWISEVMLQQTRVDTVKPYYRRFLEAFPDVKTLAEAPLDRVLKLWEGLGYYSRARNLHRAANLLLSQRGGEIPDSLEELVLLPGIGRSTAGAIAAIAFRRDVPILDSNVKRVLSRLHTVRENAGTSVVTAGLWELSRRMILEGKGRETALALMDLGATVCTPTNPRCGACPIAERCGARILGLQGSIPPKRTAKTMPVRDFVAAVVRRRDGRILIGRRPEGGLLGGMWGFPGGKPKAGETLEDALIREMAGKPGVGVEIIGKCGSIRHAYSHFRIRLHGFRCRVKEGKVRNGAVWRWVETGDLGEYAVARADRKLMEIALKGDRP